MKHYGFIDRITAKNVFFGSLLFLIAIIPFNEGGNGYILQLITQLLLLLWATIWAIQTLRRGKIVFIFDWIDLFVLGFLAWSLVSSAFSAYKYATILELIKIFSYTALFYLCRILFPLEKRRMLVLIAIVGSSAFQFLTALYLYLAHHTPVLQSGFVNTNNFACFLLIGINIGLSFIVFFRDDTGHFSEKQIRIQKIAVGVLLGGMVIMLLAVQSRGAAVSLAGTGLFLTTLRKKKLGLIFLILFCLLILLPMPGGSVFQRLRKADDPFAYQRIGIWKSSLKMVADHPAFGVGPGLFKYYGNTYTFPVEHLIARYGKRLNAAHNDLLQIAAELGIVGFVLFFGGICRVGYYSVVQLRKHPLSWQTVAASAGILGILIQGLFSNLLLSPAIAVMMALFSVILIDGAKHYDPKPVTFLASWRWYIVFLVVGIYILIPVIGYPFLGHFSYLKYQKSMEEGDIPHAAEHLETAIDYVPIHPTYHYSLGMLYLKAFRNLPNLDTFYGGYKALNEAIRYNPRNANFYNGLATLHREMFYRKLRTKPTAENALREYRRALQYNPYNPFFRLSMATLHAELGEFDQAIALLRQAVTIEPNFVGGYQMLGKMLSHLQQPTEAKEAFQQAEEILRRYDPQAQGADYVRSLLRPIQ